MSNISSSLSLGLERISAVLNILKHPEQTFATIHVAGTNGKGSVCAFIASVFCTAGYKTGKFVSPYLREPRDAITINNIPVTEKIWLDAIAKVQEAVTYLSTLQSNNTTYVLTTFELWTATSFLIFHEEKVDIAIIEVGVGGKEDATNIIPPPIAAVITSIDMDHMELLGPTISAIAQHKAGIIKKGCGVVIFSSNMKEDAEIVIREVAKKEEVHCIKSHSLEKCNKIGYVESNKYNNLYIPLKLTGIFQLENAGLALDTLKTLQSSWTLLTNDAIQKGFENVDWPGRMSQLNIQVKSLSYSLPCIVDGGHNEAAIQLVRKSLDDLQHDSGASNIIFIYACTASRNLVNNLKILLRPHDTLFAVPFPTPEGMPWIRHHPVEKVVDVGQAYLDTLPAAFESIEDALLSSAKIHQSSMEKKITPPIIAICGSLYLVSEIYRNFVPLIQ